MTEATIEAPNATYREFKIANEKISTPARYILARTQSLVKSTGDGQNEVLFYLHGETRDLLSTIMNERDTDKDNFTTLSLTYKPPPTGQDIALEGESEVRITEGNKNFTLKVSRSKQDSFKIESPDGTVNLDDENFADTLQGINLLLNLIQQKQFAKHSGHEQEVTIPSLSENKPSRVKQLIRRFTGSVPRK